MKTKKLIYILLLPLFIYSCKPEVNDFKPSNGNADFTSFVAVGNSLTAGYASGALYTSGQEAGFANILAKQMVFAGGNGIFKIPLMPTEDGVGVAESGNPPTLRTKLVMGYSTDCLGQASLAPVPAVANPDQQKLAAELMTSVAGDGPFNNIAVPGIKVGHLFAPGLGTLNPFYGRFAENPQTDVLISEAAKVNPTFFLLWIGNNDVLDYAASGGLAPITPVDGDVGFGFRASYTAAIQTLMQEAPEGVVANIPSVTSAPYFTTVPYNPVVLTDPDVVSQLNSAYALYNQMMEANGLPYRINWALGQNPMVIFDKDMPLPEAYAQFKFRQIKADELVLLSIPQDSIKCAQWGTAKPVPDMYVLTEKEIQKVNNATQQFNKIIKENVDANNLAFLNVNSLMKQISEQGIMADGVEFTSTLVTGNLFSLDGIHLSAQGNALVANYYIRAINSKYNSAIPQVNITDYPPILLP